MSAAQVVFGKVTQVSPLLVRIDGDEAADTVRVGRRAGTVSIDSDVLLIGRTVAGGSVWTAVPWVTA